MISSLVVGSGVHLVPGAPVVVEIAKRRCPRWLSRAVVVEMLDHIYPTAGWLQSLVAVFGFGVYRKIQKTGSEWEHCFVMNEVFWGFGELSSIQGGSEK